MLQFFDQRNWITERQDFYKIKIWIQNFDSNYCYLKCWFAGLIDFFLLGWKTMYSIEVQILIKKV